jgi:integrase
VELPRPLAVMLARHKLPAADSSPRAFVFASRTGRALVQRNVMRALRAAQRNAVDQYGRPKFSALYAQDGHGRTIAPPRGADPSFHSFRHTAASEAIAAGESAEEVSWQLGHKNSVVTRTVYIQEIKSAERAARRRARMEARYGDVLEAGLTS